MQPLTLTAAALAAALAAMPPALAASEKAAQETSGETSAAGCASNGKCTPVCEACVAKCKGETPKCAARPKKDPEENHPCGTN